MPEAAVALRLDRIDSQLAGFGELFGRVSDLMERMVRVEEQKAQLDRRTEGTEKAVKELDDKLDTKFEKLADKFEKKVDDTADRLWTEVKTTNEKLNQVIMKVVWISAMLSACAGVLTIIGREIVTKLFH